MDNIIEILRVRNLSYDYEFILDDFEVNYINNKYDECYNSYFVKRNNEGYLIIYGMYETVPYYENFIYKVK